MLVEVVPTRKVKPPPMLKPPASELREPTVTWVGNIPFLHSMSHQSHAGSHTDPAWRTVFCASRLRRYQPPPPIAYPLILLVSGAPHSRFAVTEYSLPFTRDTPNSF